MHKISSNRQLPTGNGSMATQVRSRTPVVLRGHEHHTHVMTTLLCRDMQLPATDNVFRRHSVYLQR